MRTVLATLGLGFLGAALTGGVGAAATPLAAGLAGGVAGNLATDLFKHLDRKVCERFLDGWSGIDENHHIVAALRLAQIDALRALIAKFEGSLGKDDDRLSDQAGFGFAARVKSFLSEETKVAQARSFSVGSADIDGRKAVIARLPDTFDDALAARRGSNERGEAGSAIAQVRSVAESVVLDELRVRCGDSAKRIPVAFEDLFLGNEGVPGWFDLFVRDAADKLTHPDSEFAAIWNAEQTALIKAYVEATTATSAASFHAIESLRQRFDHSLPVLAAVQTKLDEIHEEIKLIGSRIGSHIKGDSSADSKFIPFNAISNSPLYEECKELILYMYVNDALAYLYSSGYEYECLRVGALGQYFGFEYTPYAIDITRDETNPKRNRPHYRLERLKWLSVASLLVSAGVLDEELRGDRVKTKFFKLSSQGKTIAAEFVNWLEKNDPKKVPVKDFFQ